MIPLHQRRVALGDIGFFESHTGVTTSPLSGVKGRWRDFRAPPPPPSSFALFFSETRFRALGDLGLGDSNVHGAAKEKGISSVPQNFSCSGGGVAARKPIYLFPLCVNSWRERKEKNKTKMGKELRTKSYIHFGRETAMVFLARGGSSRKKEK